MTNNYPKAQKNVYSVPFLADELGEFVLWYFTGSKCNLECSHCYVESGPKANKHPDLSYKTFKKRLYEALATEYEKLEIYFTGGEPFMNPDIYQMLEEALKHGNSTILTNATLITKNRAKYLQEIQKRSNYDLSFRVSLEGPDKDSNNAIRGEKSFNKARTGLSNLVRVGFNPIVTIMRNWPESNLDEVLTQFNLMLESVGIPDDKQRLKILPPLHIGRETSRSGPYTDKNLFTDNCFSNYDYKNLQCCKCRTVSENGVWVCPILINEDEAQMGNTLLESAHDFPMRYMVCRTCRMEGMDCTN
ncbi:MAG: radical SAM protein [Candidatus Hodarchaeota archaeon]